MGAAAFLLGLAGSLHCIGMCSPLAMAVTRISRPVLISKALYNGGRIFTYCIMGAFAGVIGGLFDFFALQKTFSILVGTGLIIFGISKSKPIPIPMVSHLLVRLTHMIKKSFGTLLKKRTRLSMLVLGIMNGLLPCGLTYMAIAYTMTAPGPAEGSLFMLLFGAGTLPAMAGMSFGLNHLVSRFNLSLPRINAAILIFVGLLLVARNFIHLPFFAGFPEIPMPEPLCR